MSRQAGKSPGRREVKAAVALQQPPPPQGALPLAPAPLRRDVVAEAKRRLLTGSDWDVEMDAGRDLGLNAKAPRS